MNTTTKPAVGQGGSTCYLSDTYAVVVTEVSTSGKTVKVRSVEASERMGETGGFGYRFRATEEDLANPVGPEKVFTMRSNGRYVQKGSPTKSGLRLSVGQAIEYRNPHY